MQKTGIRPVAIGYLQRAMELDPALSECTYNLNVVAAYDRLGDAEKSAAAMARYRKLLAETTPP